MKKIRQHNDFTVRWSLVKKDTQEPFILEGMEVSLVLKNLFASKELNDFIVQGNTIEWEFKGKEQTQLGVHTLTLTAVGNKMLTTDACDFVDIVDCDCKTGGDDPAGLETQTISLTSVVEFGAGGGDLSAYLTKIEAEETFQPKGDYATAAELTELSAEVGKKVDADKVATINGQSLVEGGNITIEGGKGEKGDKGDKGDQGNSGYTGAADELEVVNNLTQGGATAALSAEMGRVLSEDVQIINDVLQIETTTQVIEKELVDGVDYTTKSGYAPLGTGVINNNQSFGNTGDIHLNNGDKVSVTLSAPSSVSIIAKKVSDTTYQQLVAGEAWNKLITAEYIAEEECDILVSYQVINNMSHSIVVTREVTATDSERLTQIEEKTNAVPSLQDNLEGINNKVMQITEDGLSQDIISGYFINHKGELKTNSSFAYKEFFVKAGTLVKVKSDYVNPSIAFLAKKHNVPLSPLEKYEELVSGANYTAQEAEYYAAEDMTIAVSFGITSPALGTNSITLYYDVLESNSINIDSLQNRQDNEDVQDIELGFLFNKIAVIGDSLASGRVEGIEGQTDAVGADYYGFSWLSFLAKRWGCEKYKNFSRGGQKTADWITEWLPQLQEDVAYDAYFIALGTNNEYNESNIEGDIDNYNNFIARYNSIIDSVRAKAPHSAIFLVSLYEKREGNAALESIANTRMANDDGIYYVDFVDNALYHRYSPNVNWRGHFSSVGYAYVAKVINAIVNNIVWDNQTKEFWQQFAKYHNL